MESLPLIGKSKIIPNPDVTSLLREIFQTEFESYVPSKKLSENLRKSLQYEKLKEDFEGQTSFRSVHFLENLPNEKGKLMDYAERILEAYGKHEQALNRITKVELNIMETQAMYLRKEEIIKRNGFLRNLLTLKKCPLMKCYNLEYVKEYKLLQGDSALPPKHEAEADFRMKEYHIWKKRLSNYSEDDLSLKWTNIANIQTHKIALPRQKKNLINGPGTPKPEEKEPKVEVFRAEPTAICFMDYSPGCVYSCRVTVRNVHTKPMKFVLKPLSMQSPFKVEIYGTETTRILPGFGFKLLVTFKPRSLDNENDNVHLLIEDGSKLLIPLSSCLEPPILKTNEDLDEYTKNVADRIRSSYIECGECFPGDSKVTKIRFHSFGGTGEFFLMSRENWDNWHIDCLTSDNFTDLPPFRFYPSYFKVDKNQVIDLYVEFKPLTFGLHSDNIVIACSNGEVRNLDILGDGIAWNRSFITFEETLEKNFPPYINDDHRATYYLDMGSTLSTGKTEKIFCITNNSNTPFEFRWEMRDVVVPFKGQEEPEKLLTTDVKIDPCSQVFEPCTSRTFLVSVNFQNRPVARYRTVLSLYIIGLPYQSIEQASTIIRPSLLHRRFKSRSELGEEDNLLLSPEFSYQGTYESIQEGMKSSGELKYQQQFPGTVCRKHPSICAVPLKRSKTYSNIGISIDACTCSTTHTPEAVETVKNCEYDSFPRKPNITELGSDLLWDFVDVLVDEIELWAEVVPTIITIEPWIVNLYDNLRLNQAMEHEIYVNNHNNCTVTCKWTTIMGKHKNPSKVSRVEELSTLYRKREVDKQQEPESESEYGEEGEYDHLFRDSGTTNPDNYQITCYTTQRACIYDEMIPKASKSKCCDIQVDPSGAFKVPPFSRYRCVISVSAIEPGFINKVLNLMIENDESAQLHIVGRVPDREISVYPLILDFGVRKRGTRYTKHFKIKNESKDPIQWKVEQYNVNYDEQDLSGPVGEERQSGLKYLSGTLEEHGCTIESYKLDARKPGLKTNLLKFELSNPVHDNPRGKYLMVLADVQTPELAIEAPRFENAILAPSRTMYIGEVITQNIILRNMKNVPTTFIWGYPFGCHCRKLKINLSPKLSVIGGLKNVVVQVNITPLEEGIVEHCYIPCFFSRNVDPALLSIVGVIENVRVMFEVTKENLHPCNIGAKEKKSIMKITWPIKNFDPTIGMSYIPENKILDFICHCDEVDADYTRKTDTQTRDVEGDKDLTERSGEFYIPEENEEEDVEEEEREEDQQEPKQPCIRKYYTPTRMKELKSEIMRKKGVTFDAEELMDEIGDERTGSLIKEADSDSGVIVEYPKRECIDLLYYAASELQFLNMVYKTASVKHFVIRNLSPISVNFSLRVRYFGKVEQLGHRDKVQEIKDRVFGQHKDEFENHMIYGQPLLITTSPSEGVLEGWQSVRISVFAYGNTWGEYRDFIICDVCGIPPFVVKVFVQLSGHPVTFPMFKASPFEIPILRFSAVKYKSAPVVRRIRVRNTSSIPITVTWIAFLTSPVSHETKEEPFSLCLDFYTDKESEDPEKMTKSSHNYLSKNTSGSVPLFDDIEKSYSHCTANDPLSETDSGKKDSPMMRGYESDLTPKTFADSTKPEIQLLENFGKVDLHIFQISPKELDLEPYAEQKLTITFDPNYYVQNTRLQEYEAVVTGCVRLRQEYAHYPGIYQRSCGQDYVSKLLYMSASVEKPLLQFDVSQNDLTYILNGNEVVEGKEYKKMRKYLVRNRCETPITILLKIEPGVVFSIKRISSLKNVSSKDKLITIEPGSSIEIHLEMSITRSQLVDMFKTFEFEGPKRRTLKMTKSSGIILKGAITSDSDSCPEKLHERESKFCDNGSSITSCSSYQSGDTDSKFGMKPLDSFIVIENKAKHWKNSSNTDDNISYCFKKQDIEEYLGESLDISPTNHTQPESGHVQLPYIVEEDLVFHQAGLAKQVLTMELQVYFPLLKINPEVIDFGQVHIGETSRRYASIINLTPFPTVFIVANTGESKEFLVHPNSGYLPATKSDTGVELAVDFAPKEPGYFKNTFKIYGNEEMEFRFSVLTVSGLGTWNEMYKYPRIQSQTKLFSTLSYAK